MDKRLPGGELRSSEIYKTKELNIIDIVQRSGLELNEVNPMILEMFTDKDFVFSLPEAIKSDPDKLAAWLKHSNAFNSIRHNNEIFGENIIIPETKHADGRIRREESGQEILVDQIEKLEIDPESVLFFRRTQPTSEVSNPEHYWTSDYWETVSGLQQEISGENREKSVILCSSLADISSDSKLIADINDDNGLPVRRVADLAYDQKRCLFVINSFKNI